MNSHIEELRETIEFDFQCRATHAGSTAVIQMGFCRILWMGYVEVFDIEGPLDVKRCYGWVTPEGRTVTILGWPHVPSASAAVRDELVYGTARCLA